MSSSQSSASCGEMKTLSISTPVLLTSVKSCAAPAAEFAFDALALAAGLAAGEAAALAFAVALAFAGALEFAGAGAEQAAVRSSAQATPQIRLSFFINLPSVCDGRILAASRPRPVGICRAPR